MNTKLATDPNDFSLNGRRSTRIPMRVPVRLGCKGAGGFETLDGWTVVLNAHGGKVECARPFDLGDEVLITVPGTGRSELGVVVWRDEKRNKSGNFEFGAELDQAQSLWGVGFPPSDWARRRASTLPQAPEPGRVTVTRKDAKSLDAGAGDGSEQLDLTAELRDVERLDSSTELPDGQPFAASASSLRDAPMNEPVGHDQPLPMLSGQMSAESFSAAAAALLNSLVSLLEKRGVLTREDLYAEIRRFSSG